MKNVVSSIRMQATAERGFSLSGPLNADAELFSLDGTPINTQGASWHVIQVYGPFDSEDQAREFLAMKTGKPVQLPEAAAEELPPVPDPEPVLPVEEVPPAPDAQPVPDSPAVEPAAEPAEAEPVAAAKTAE